MAKKKNKSSKGVSPEKPSSAISNTDLKTLIHDHSLFFDRLVEVIPSRFYLPSDDKEKPWYHGLSKAAKASARKESRENVKKARRQRLDPEKSSSTLDLLQKSIEAQKENLSGSQLSVEDNEDADIENPTPAASNNRSVTYEELRQRLRRRIEDLRSNRNTRTQENPKLVKEKEQERKKGDASLGKRKCDEISGEKEENKHKLFKKENEKDPSSVDLCFGYVKINQNDGKRNKKGLSKHNALAKAERLQEAKNDPEKGEIVSKKHSWKAAVSRAAGAKVHDDPKLIKESIKKEKKKREKNTQKWKERKETVQKLKAEKQKKRADNISEMIHQKKSRKIAKREKKLMRPGFEGRKAGYVNES